MRTTKACQTVYVDFIQYNPLFEEMTGIKVVRVNINGPLVK